MSDIAKRLRASVGMDAINGDSFERNVCSRQMSEAALEIDSLNRRIAEQAAEIARLKEELDHYESDYTLCDCCECMSMDCVDVDGHSQCKSCTTIAALREQVARMPVCVGYIDDIAWSREPVFEDNYSDWSVGKYRTHHRPHPVYIDPPEEKGE